MRETPDLPLAKTALHSVDPVILQMWHDYIRLTDAELIDAHRRMIWVGSIVGVVALLIGFGLGTAAHLVLRIF